MRALGHPSSVADVRCQNSLPRILLARWYAVVAGLLLTLVVAAMAYSLIPARYAATGTAVLIRPRLVGPESANPLLTFDNGLNMSALILVQGLNDPTVPLKLGLIPGQDAFEVKNGGGGDVNIDGIQQPFVTVTATSSDAAKATAIVGQVMDLGRADLAARQAGLRVPTVKTIKLQNVVDPTPPKRAWAWQLRGVGIALVVGLACTLGLAYGSERLAATRRSRSTGRDHEPEAEAIAALEVVDRAVPRLQAHRAEG
jgi:hypothetical protein